MKLLELGHRRWRVYAILDHRGQCQVLDELYRLGPNNRTAVRMVSLLSEVVPEKGMNLGSEKVKKIEGYDHLFEFRSTQNKGPGTRVLFFTDENRVIVCTHTFEKQSKTPRSFLERANDARQAYIQAKQKKQIQYESL